MKFRFRGNYTIEEEIRQLVLYRDVQTFLLISKYRIGAVVISTPLNLLAVS